LRRDTIEGATRRASSLERLSLELGHELKNPLASIKGLLQLDQRSGEDPAQTRRTAVALREVQRMQDTLHDYLSFARPLAPLDAEPVKVREFFRELEDLLQPRLIASQVTWTLRSDVGDEMAIVVDRRRLREAMINLLVNAIEASSPGQPVVLSLTRAEEHLVVTICDEGPGVSERVRPQLGTPFLTTKTHGTGLGIAIAKAIIEQHGGQLAYPPVPSGTQVAVRLPWAAT
ncbi:MAG: HAMP domain-containing histidine kinase, partial [Myxococcales bacterium FL481]